MPKGSKPTSQSRRKKRRKVVQGLDTHDDPSPVLTPSGILNFNTECRTIDCFAKAWSPEFATKRDYEEKFWVDINRELDAVGEDIVLFLDDIDPDHLIPCSKAKEIADFVGDAKLHELRSASGVAGYRQAAWLDDRSSCCWDDKESLCLTCCLERHRSYENPMTATTLYRSARLQRFGLEKRADADRRLIYISNLDPYYILALAETAGVHERKALTDAIWNHLALQTSIKVKIPSEGFVTFRLELYLPYLALRKAPAKHCPEGTIKRKPYRKWIDISFLGAEYSQSFGPSPYGVGEAQFSFVICGTANERWVGYAFDDSPLNEDDVESRIHPCEGYHTDPIAKGKVRIDAELPIWCPREYYLLVLKNRIQEAFKEWDILVRTIEIRVNDLINKHSSLFSQDPRVQREKTADDPKQTHEWTQQTNQLLSYLLEHISRIIKAWDGFISPSGDIAYFSVMNSGLVGNPQDKARRSLRSIQETMENLANLESRLKVLHKSCHDFAESFQIQLQIRLEHEANTAVQINAKITHFMVSIVTPLTLTIAYFSIPQGSIPFKLEGKYFPVANFLMMGAIQLLFLAICALPSWWTGFQARTRTLTLERALKTFEWVSRAGKQRKQDGDQGEAGNAV